VLDGSLVKFFPLKVNSVKYAKNNRSQKMLPFFGPNLDKKMEQKFWGQNLSIFGVKICEFGQINTKSQILGSKVFHFWDQILKIFTRDIKLVIWQS
jgi:hypothetical protein